MIFQNALNEVHSSLISVYGGVLEFLPKILVAIIVVLIGWLVAAALAQVVAQIIRSIKLDKALSTAGLDKVVAKSGHTLNSGKFLGELARWFTIVVFFVPAFEILDLQQVNEFLKETLIPYIPNVFAAALILFIGVIVADYLSKFVLASAKTANLSSVNFFASIAKWAVWIATAFAAMDQLEIKTGLIDTLLMGLVVALSLAFGLAFGLGGRDAAARYIEKVRSEIADRN